MEVGTFVDSAVAEQLENHFVEARLHTDVDPTFRDLENALTGSVGQPIYLVVPANSDLAYQEPTFDPARVKILSRQDGATLGDPTKFVDFL
ncbi:MAG: hypothetical protein KDB61_07885, partial [Planctomycetes bacterium]|nr:hypothetical protein [Planctomycetota bacterium]